MLQHRLRNSLLAAQLVGAATLLRSIAYDRWITVLASVLLIAGALAAQRGRTWGIVLAFAAAMAFPVAWAIGIAPAWFCLVGVAGAMPFMQMLPSFARFDRKATALLTIVAATLGALGAVTWKNVALAVFTHVPLLRPSIHANHGLLLAALVGGAILASSRRAGGASSEPRVRIGEGEGVRVGDVDTSMESDARDEEEAAADEEVRPRGRMRSS